MEQVAADVNPPVAHIEPNGALSGPHPALIDDLLAGRFFSIDVRGQVTGWNPRAESAFGWSTHHVSGASLFEKLLVSGLGFGADELEDFFAAAATNGAGRRVRALLQHQAGGQLPVELSIVPIQLAKAYELNAFLQDVSTSTASGVDSELGRVREEHAPVLGMISDSLAENPPTPADEVRLAGALVVFHIDAGAMTMMPPGHADESSSGGVPSGPPVGTAVAEDAEIARAEAERVRAQIDEALAAADEARAEAAVARDERDQLRAQLAEIESGAPDVDAARADADSARAEAEELRARAEEVEASAESSRAEAEEARRDAERLRGELEGLRAAATGSQASAEQTAAELGSARAELSQAKSDVERLGEQLSAAEAELGSAREERDQLRAELEELRRQVEAAGEAAASLEEARAQVESLTSELSDARAEAEAAQAEVAAAQQRAEEIAADAEAAREGGQAAEAAVASAREEAHAAQADLAEARSQVSSLEAELAEARTRVETAEGELEAARGEAEAARAEAESAREDLEALSADAEAAKADVATAREETETVRAELLAALEETEAARVEAEGAKAEVESARSEAESATAEIESARAEAESAKAEIESAREQAEADAREKIEAAQEQAEAARAEVESAREEARAAQAEVEAAREKAEAAQAEIESARAELESAREEAQAAAREEIEAAEEQAEAARAELATAGERADAAAEELAAAKAELKTAQEEVTAIRAELDAAHAQAESAGKNVGDAQAELGEAKSDAVKARAEADKATAEAEEAKAAAEQAEAAAETARAEIDQAKAEAEEAKAAAEQARADADAARAEAEQAKADAEAARAEVVDPDGVEDHDPVTGLFNRRAFEEQLSRQVAGAAKGGDRGAALMLDLDHEELDAEHGEQLLKSVAEALKQNVSGAEMLAHLGGDEFAVLLPHADAAQARKIAEHIVEAVGPEVMKVGDTSVRITVDVGVALFDERDAGEPEVIEGERVASTTRETLPAPIEQPQPAAGSTALAPADGVADRVRRALAEDTFMLYAQPIIDLRTSEVTQYELLIRMQDESGRLVLPDKFLPGAQQAGLMPQIDQWVVRHAIGLIHQAAQDGRRLMLEVNISSDSVDHPALPELIEAELDATGIDPRLLVIEVTEDAALAKIQETIKLSKWIRSVGCRFALDDFGSTFATVKYLKDMPVDYFKLDGDLIVTLPESRTNQLLLNALMDVARGTGTQTIAVYVPDDETLVMLRQYGIGYGQGNRVGRPRPVAEI